MPSAERAALAGALAVHAGPGAEVPCTHCGLTVPAGLVEAGAGRQFCCTGCRTW